MRGRRILALREYQGRNPHGYFQDLSLKHNEERRTWLWLWRQKWGATSRNGFAILVGRAKLLAMNPPTTAWGVGRWPRYLATMNHQLSKQQRYKQRQPACKERWYLEVGPTKDQWRTMTADQMAVDNRWYNFYRKRRAMRELLRGDK